MLLVAGGLRHREALLERLATIDAPGLERRGADVVERVDDDLLLAQRLGQRDRAPAPVGRRRAVRREHRELGAVGVRHGELRPGRELLELLDRLGGEALGVGVLAVEPVQAREPAAVVALGDAVAELAVAGERLLARFDRVDHLVGQVALVRAALEQHRLLLGRQLAGPAQGARELRGRLAVRAEPRRVLAGHGRVPQHRGGVAGRLGVVGEPRGVGAARVEPLEHLAVQRRAAPRRHLGLEREPRQLVAEGDGAAVHPRHARQQAFVERLVGGVDQLRVGGAGDDGQALEQLARRRAQAGGPGEHGVADRGRDGGGGRGQHLGDVERVAAGAEVQGVGVDPVRLGQRAHRLGGQRRQLDALDAHGGGQLAEHDAQRAGLVVAEGDDGE